MRLMRVLIPLLAVCLLIVQPSTAQQDSYAYGQPSDLKGLSRVYIETGPDVKLHDSIIHDLEKSKLDFKIVDDEKDAEIILTFRMEGWSGGGIVTVTNIRGKD